MVKIYKLPLLRSVGAGDIKYSTVKKKEWSFHIIVLYICTIYIVCVYIYICSNWKTRPKGLDAVPPDLPSRSSDFELV